MFHFDPASPQQTKENDLFLESIQNEPIEKLVLDKHYNAGDIKKCISVLFEKFGHNYEKQFRIFDYGSQISLSSNVDEPSFIIYLPYPKQWGVICVVKTNGSLTLLHKASQCSAMPSVLEASLRAQHTKLKIIYHQSTLAKNNSSSGPLCIRNLSILLKETTKDTVKLVANFAQMKFCSEDTIAEIKKQYLIEKVTELSEKKDFLDELGEFIDSIPNDFINEMRSFENIFNEELSKNEDEVNVERLMEANKKYINDSSIKSFLLQKKNNDSFEFRIEEKFPTEMKQYRIVLMLLKKMENSGEFVKFLQIVSIALRFPAEKVKLLFDFYKEEDCAEASQTCAKSVTEIAEMILQEIKSKNNTCTNPSESDDFKKLLRQTHYLNANIPSSLKIRMNNANLHKQYEEITAKFKGELALTTAKAIEETITWAKANKENRGLNLVDALAMINRAYNIISSPCSLRNPQILALLLCLSSGKHGKLAQIETGEGKTLLVAALAIIKALQGYKVDIVTSNIILAKAAHTEFQIFYDMFQVSVSVIDNDLTDKDYAADVIYTTISALQFDYLCETMQNMSIRNGRAFDVVVLDEVDSLVLDQGAYITKISTPFPGMEALRYIYLKIWQDLDRAERAFRVDAQRRIEEILAKMDADGCKVELVRVLGDLCNGQRDYLKATIKAANPANLSDVPLIPKHLKQFVAKQMDVWIESAIYAKYDCHEFKQYRVSDNEHGEKSIVPVDYCNTGATLKNTIWSNALHQFVQLKHNLYLTFESLPSSYISNMGFIGKYKHENIIGLTGTIGSEAEQILLSELYKVKFVKIPPHKPKMFEEYEGIVVEDGAWSDRVAKEILDKVEKRAVLVIFETEADLIEIKGKLNDRSIRIFADEDDAHVTENVIQVGDIILATNISGRGCNYKTHQALESNGGLHVPIAFLPCNQRVEDQATGRTARQGNNGSAQIIVRKSKLKSFNNQTDFKQIKLERDRLEMERLNNIRKVLVKEIRFKDELFNLFAQSTPLFKSDKMQDYYVSADLKEFWAFWLHNKNYDGRDLPVSAQNEFELFRNEAKHIYDGNIQHNPYNCILQASYFQQVDSNAKAKQSLKKAIELTPIDDENAQVTDLAAGAHLKLFQIAMEEGKQLRKRAFDTIRQIFFVPVDPTESYDYKIEAAHHLEKAEGIISQEIQYIDNNILHEDADNNVTNILIDTNVAENTFLKHLHAKRLLLDLHRAQINELRRVLKEDEHFSLAGELPMTLESIGTGDEKLREAISTNEVCELQALGLRTMYSISKLRECPKEVKNASRVQIVEGIALFSIGCYFPPMFPSCALFSVNVVTDAMLDITFEILFGGKMEFQRKKFIAAKCISQAINVLILGLSSILKMKVVIEKAIAYSQKFAKMLRSSPFLKEVCAVLADAFESVAAALTKCIQVSLNACDKMATVSSAVTYGASKYCTEVGTMMIKMQLVEPLLNATFVTIKNYIKIGFVKAIKNHEKMMIFLISIDLKKLIELLGDFRTTFNVAKLTFNSLDGIANFSFLNNEHLFELLNFVKVISNFLNFVNTTWDRTSNVQHDKVDERVNEVADQFTEEISLFLKPYFKDLFKLATKMIPGTNEEILALVTDNNDIIKFIENKLKSIL